MEMLKIVLIIEGRKKERKKGREGRKKGRVRVGRRVWVRVREIGRASCRERV